MGWLIVPRAPGCSRLVWVFAWLPIRSLSLGLEIRPPARLSRISVLSFLSTTMHTCTRCIGGCASAAAAAASAASSRAFSSAAVPFHYTPLFQLSKEPKCQFRRLDKLSSGESACLHACLHAAPIHKANTQQRYTKTKASHKGPLLQRPTATAAVSPDRLLASL